MTQTHFLETDAAFALRVKQLQDRLYSQMERALEEFGLVIPSKTTGIVQLLYSKGPCSKADIAKTLLYSHQLTAQRLAWLVDHKMAKLRPDVSDRRRQLASLTSSGIEQAARLQDFLPRLSDAYAHLFAELDINLNSLIERTSVALDETSITERIKLSDPDAILAGRST